MLTLLLLLASDPAASVPPVLMIDVAAELRALDRAGGAGLNCANARIHRVDQTADAPRLQTDLTFKAGDDVRRYLLVERSVGGCSAPISFALPNNQGGSIPELGRTAPGVSMPDRVR